MSENWLHNIFLISFFKRFYFYLFLERRKVKEKARERNIAMSEKHQSVASHLSAAEDLAHNPGMWPKGE